MTNKAKVMMDEACAEMKIYHGPQNYQKYKAASDKFDKAMKLCDEASELIEEK